MMKYRNFSGSNFKISQIGVGCMSLPTNEHDYTALIHEALDFGISFFDTADVYQRGVNEVLLGKALKNRRHAVTLSTKGGNVLRQGDTQGFDWDASPKYLSSAVEASLTRLNTDCIDYYQLHGGILGNDFYAIAECFEKLKQQGKIKEYGISSIRPNVIEDFCTVARPAGVMVQYNLLDRRPEETVFPFLEARHIPVFCRGALAGGLLINKAAKTYVNRPLHEIETAQKAFNELALGGNTKTGLLLKFVLAEQAVLCAVTGFSSSEQLREICHVNDQPDISTADMQRLRTVLQATTYTDHRSVSKREMTQ